MTESIYTTRYRRLCELLVEARKSRGLSQAALAERLGWLQTVISKYERGERRLDLIEFLDVAQALEIDPHRIIRRLKVADV
ncbi:MAG: helix-turn-helix domain-containing protein [Gammaproteobacteria bacterium]